MTSIKQPNPLRVSIITPVFNGAAFIEQTIQSVLDQTYPHVEYIIVDGGSTDGTLEIVQKYRNRIAVVISERDHGLWDAVNKGMRAATGDILAFLGSDDLLMPWGVNCVVEYFSRIPSCEWLTGVPTLFDTKGNMVWVAPVVPHYRRQWISKRYYTSRGLGPMQMESIYWKRGLMERTLLDGGKVFDDTLKAAADIDLWCRFAKHAELYQIGTVIAGWRKHSTNISTKYWDQEAKGASIPYGKLLGAGLSFLTFAWHRVIGRKKRLKELMLMEGDNT
jgi:glycosyltransferase involved in cell wall biosynthesis